MLTAAPTINAGTATGRVLSGTAPRRSQPRAPLVIPTDWLTRASLSDSTGDRW